MNLEVKGKEGFHLLDSNERFMGLIGPWYYKDLTINSQTSSVERILGIEIEERHTNLWGYAHGGLLITMADSALGYSLSRATSPKQPLVTASLNSNFFTPAKKGDFIESYVKVTRIGSRLRFGDCELKVNNQVIFKANGIFAVIQPIKT